MDIFAFFDDNNIIYTRYDHAPVFTVDDAREGVPPLEAVETKNLFLRDSKGKRHFLVVVEHTKAVDLRQLSELIGSSRLGFASADRLQRFLGITPGSVTILALVNDVQNEVELILDEDVASGDYIACHPLVNTSTVVLAQSDVRRILDITSHIPRVVRIPMLACA